MSSIKIYIRFFICLISTLACCATADRPPEPPLNPHTYYSPNKQFALKVVPSDRQGFGRADYLLTQNGIPVLHREFPFTLAKAAISDKGDIAGYSYSSPNKDDKSQMHLWLLSAQGKIKLDKSFDQHYGGLDGPRLPLTRDVFIHQFNQAATFAVYDNGSNPQWISYSLANGQEISTIVTSFETYRDRIKKIVTSDVNPYSLISISHRIGKDDDWHSNEEFCLLDKVWEKKDCKIYPDEFSKATSPIRDNQYNAVINNDQYMGFTEDNKLWVTSFNKLTQDFFAIRYSLLNHQTTLEQLDSKPITTNAKVEPTLKPVKQLTALADRAVPKSILNGKELFTAIDMAFDDVNQKAVISRKDGAYYFERYDDSNKKTFSTALKINGEGFTKQDFIYYKNNQWLLLLSRYDEQSRLVLLSNKGNLIREIKIDAPGAVHIAKSKKNTIYILTSKSNQGASLVEFNIETGDTIFRKNLKNYYDDGIVITNDQKVAILGKNGAIDFYSLFGEYLQSVDVAKMAGIKDAYVKDIQADLQGLIYVFDFSSHQLISFSGNKLHSKSNILRGDGKQIENIYFMKFDVKNNLWVSSENGSFIHINGSGKEEGRIQKADATQPSNINWMYVDKEENIFIFDNSQYLLSRIDKNGVVKNIYQSPAKDQIFLTSIARVSWKTQNGFLIKEGGRYVHINENGKQLADFSVTCDNRCTDIIPFVRSGDYWRVKYTEVDLVSEIRNVQDINIQKDKDENWLELIHRISQNENDWLSVSSAQKLIAIDPSGKIQATFPLDDYFIAWAQVSGNFVYVTTHKNDLINVYNLNGTLVASAKTQNTKFNHSVSPVLYASGANKKLYALSENAIKVYSLLEK